MPLMQNHYMYFGPHRKVVLTGIIKNLGMAPLAVKEAKFIPNPHSNPNAHRTFHDFEGTKILISTDGDGNTFHAVVILSTHGASDEMDADATKNGPHHKDKGDKAHKGEKDGNGPTITITLTNQPPGTPDPDDLDFDYTAVITQPTGNPTATVPDGTIMQPLTFTYPPPPGP